MLASRVPLPVATTTASPCPCTKCVPAWRVSPAPRAAATLSPVSIDSSTLTRRAVEQLEVGADPVAGLEHDHVADDQVRGVDDLRSPVAAHGHPTGQQVAQARGGPLGAVLLREREQRR